MPYSALILVILLTCWSLSLSAEPSNLGVDGSGGFDIKADVTESFRFRNQRIRGCCIHLGNAGTIEPTTNIMLICSSALSHGSLSESAKNVVKIEVDTKGQFCGEVPVHYNTHQTFMSDSDGHQVLRNSTNVIPTTIAVISTDSHATIGRLIVGIESPPYYLIVINSKGMVQVVTTE
ncbi:MAG: hypothetical protein WCR06_03915 [bacterium]